MILSDLSKYDMTWHDTTRHDTTRHDTTRHDTTRHDTTGGTWSMWNAELERISRRCFRSISVVSRDSDTYSTSRWVSSWGQQAEGDHNSSQTTTPEICPINQTESTCLFIKFFRQLGTHTGQHNPFCLVIEDYLNCLLDCEYFLHSLSWQVISSLLLTQASCLSLQYILSKKVNFTELN